MARNKPSISRARCGVSWCLLFAISAALTVHRAALAAGPPQTDAGKRYPAAAPTDLDISQAKAQIQKEIEKRVPRGSQVKDSEGKWQFLKIPANTPHAHQTEQRYWVLRFFQTKDTDVTSSQTLYVAIVDKQGAVKEFIPICLQISAPELFAAFQENQIAANASFKGRTIWVDGTIDRILADKKENPYISLFSRHRAGEASVVCRFGSSESSSVATLKRVQEATIKGTCEGMVRMGGHEYIILSDCVVVDPLAVVQEVIEGGKK